MSPYAFLDPQSSFPLPRTFDFAGYIEAEREYWALFPETEGKRVNFCQLGLTAQLYVQSEVAGEIAPDETYFLMPCDDGAMKPVRMRAFRRLTLSEYRMAHITACRLFAKLHGTAYIMAEVHQQVLGPGFPTD